ASYAPILAPASVTLPGGIALIGPSGLPAPMITSILPRTTQPGLRIRVDGTWTGNPTGVFIGAGPGPGQTVQIPPANITILNPGNTFTAVIPPQASLPSLGVVDVVMKAVTAGVTPTVQPSAPFSVQIVDNTNPGIDSPNSLTQSRSAALTLTGNNL